MKTGLLTARAGLTAACGPTPPRAALRPAQLDAVTLRDALLTQRLDDAVCAPLSVGARRELHRAVHILRHERDGVVLAATEVP